MTFVCFCVSYVVTIVDISIVYTLFLCMDTDI